jgi:hypothetical protein
MANAVRPETDGISVTDETLLSRWRFLELCAASMAGLSLLVLTGWRWWLLSLDQRTPKESLPVGAIHRIQNDP